MAYILNTEMILMKWASFEGQEGSVNLKNTVQIKILKYLCTLNTCIKSV